MVRSRPRDTRRFAVALQYIAWWLLPFFAGVGRIMGWNTVLVVIIAVLLVALTASLFAALVRTGYLKLVYSSPGNLPGEDLRLRAWALRHGLVWAVLIAAFAVYFKTRVMFGRFSWPEACALVYLAATLPASLIAWRGRRRQPDRQAWKRWLRNIAVALGALILLFVFNLFVIRPWQHNWGATPSEIARAMPGDGLVSDPDMNATRVVSVDAGPADIWPWIAQIGYQRGGFYSHDYLDNGGTPSADTVLPEYQQLGIGDMVPVAKHAYMEVVSLEHERTIVFMFKDGPWDGNTWTFGIYQQGPGQSRLVSRLRSKYVWEFPHIGPWLVIDTFEIIMMSKCLLGIRDRAEELNRARSMDS